MNEYIKRKKLVDLVLSKLKYLGDARIMNEGDEKVLSEIDGYEKALNDVHVLILDKDLIENIQPVKHGRWLEHHAIWIDQPEIEGWFVQAKCSECERWAHVMNPYTKSVGYECCPHCGARMDGDTECK